MASPLNTIRKYINNLEKTETNIQRLSQELHHSDSSDGSLESSAVLKLKKNKSRQPIKKSSPLVQLKKDAIKDRILDQIKCRRADDQK